MAAANSSPNPPELEFSRGEQLTMRRAIRLPPDEKFLLWLLDDHIGKGRSWSMTVSQLADESGYSLSKTYKALNALADRTLIFWESHGQPQREFFICWENIRAELDSPLENDDPVPFSNGESEAETFSNGESPFSIGESSFSIGESHIRNNDPPNDPINAPPPPTPEAVAVEKLIGLGVRAIARCWVICDDRGMAFREWG